MVNFITEMKKIYGGSLEISSIEKGNFPWIAVSAADLSISGEFSLFILRLSKAERIFVFVLLNILIYIIIIINLYQSLVTFNLCGMKYY